MIAGASGSSRLELHYFTNCLTRLAGSPQINKVDLLVTIEAAITLLEAKNFHTHGHSSEVAFIAYLIARHLGLSSEEQDKIRLAALVHDLGKVKSEEYPGQHALVGAQIIRLNPRLDEVADMVLFHHTRWQGAASSASPQGAAIPLGARIIAVADAFQKSFYNRRDNGIFPDGGILEELRLRAGTDFDPAVVAIVVGNYELLSRFVGPCPSVGPPIWKVYA